MKDNTTPTISSRRNFLKSLGAAGASLTLPIHSALAGLADLKKPIKLGLIADLHHDVMHDGPQRLDAFLKAMKATKPDGLIQMGDFAIPKDQNKKIIETFNNAHPVSLHVIGNHDTDHGYSKQQCQKAWGMPGFYYTQLVEGVRLIVLDGNDKGSPTHKGGYASYIGKPQTEWLAKTLKETSEPTIIISHQPLAGPGAIDNAKEVQEILKQHVDKILISICGHMHIDDHIDIDGIPYVNINSASYVWVGGKYKNQSYSEEIHKKYKWIDHTAPYKDSLFTTLTIDPKTKTISLEGMETTWVGKSPKELGQEFKNDGIEVGKHVVPKISARKIALT